MDWNTEIYGNPLLDWATALGIALAINLAVALVKSVAVTRLKAWSDHTAGAIDDALVDAVQRTKQWLVFFVTIYIGSRYLALDDRVDLVLRAMATLAAIVQIGVWGAALIRFWVGRSQRKAMTSNAAAATSLGAINFIGQLVLWSILLLAALDNLGVNVTALVAGLGVGGIAVALAAQNILGDLFASLSIVIDKPFVIGDAIAVDEFNGTVEYVGLKTTRLRGLGGEQIVFSNSDLLESRIRNYKRMNERRQVFTIGLSYDTPADLLEQVPVMIREAIEQHRERARFDRAHFASFGESTYNFEAVYIMLTPDYGQFIQVQQAINLALVRRFAEAGIQFAFPTRTVNVAGPIRIERTDPSDRPASGGDMDRDTSAAAPRIVPANDLSRT
jgi:small-conductance mechanosensitive channel